LEAEGRGGPFGAAAQEISENARAPVKIIASVLFMFVSCNKNVIDNFNYHQVKKGEHH
jgi:hypothetical protein